MKRIPFVLVLSGFIALNSSGQKTFVPLLETYKRMYQSGVIPPGTTTIRTFGDTTYFGGWSDSVAPYVRSGSRYVLGSMIRNTENMVQYSKGVWSNGPDFHMSSTGTVLRVHTKIYGKQYACVDGTSFPNNRVLNTTTNQFDSITGIHFDYGWSSQIFEMGNDDILFLGIDGSQGSANGEQFGSMILWNQRTNVMRHTYFTDASGQVGEGTPWVCHSFKLGDTVYAFEKFGPQEVIGLGPNSNIWKSTRFGKLPGLNVEYAEVFDGVAYIIVRYVTDAQLGTFIYRMYRFVNGSWQGVLDMQPKMPSQSLLGAVLGMVKYDNKIAIAANIIKAGNTSVGGVFYYDPANGAVSEIAPLPSVIHNPTDVVGIFAPDDGNLYLSSWRGSFGTGMESQTVFVLRDAAPVAPVITSPTGVVGTTAVTISGTCEADTSISISVYESQNLLGTAKADNNGRWSIACTLQEGSHTVYAVAVRPRSERSDQSANATFTVHINRAPTVTIGDTLIISHASTATISGTASDPDGDVLTCRWTQISGSTSATISSDGLLTTTVSNLSEGSYRFKLTATDPLGLTASQTLTVSVSFITSVPPVVQSGEVLLYPNPAQYTLRIRGITKVLGLYNMAGQQLTIRQAKDGNEVVLQVQEYTSGVYFVRFEYTGRKTATAAFHIIH